MRDHGESRGYDLLLSIMAPNPPPFALLQRLGQSSNATVDVLVGRASKVESLAEIPLSGSTVDVAGPCHEVLAVVPYRQITERGFECIDDATPLVALHIEEQGRLEVPDILTLLPGTGIDIRDGRFDVTDDAYADTVREVVAREIGQGEGANFVISRSFVAEIDHYSPGMALALFRRLLERETGTYWTFIVHTGDRTLVGATPERHISLRGGVATMNPISGTYRYPQGGPKLTGIIKFLSDRKEIDELYMVVDEELKMMTRICDSGARLVGPHLKEMARLAHTEYFIEGHTSMDPRDILRLTMFAPAVTGSPLENACRVIERYERNGRGYYSGVLALIGRDDNGGCALDSSILIRVADIDHCGRLTIRVGSTLVRHSEPLSEVAETRAKAAGLLSALSNDGEERFGAHPEVREALRRRNDGIAQFWLSHQGDFDPVAELVDRDVLVIDAEDDFTAMLAHQLRSLGMSVTLLRFDEPLELDTYDLVLLGPGPGDPGDHGDERIRYLEDTLRLLLRERRPFLAVCLSHQVLSGLLGFQLVRLNAPNQGTQRDIQMFGNSVRVGFYNTFAAVSVQDEGTHELVPGVIEVSRDNVTGEVHALRGAGFYSLQFHPESLLSEHGLQIIKDVLLILLQVRSIEVRDTSPGSSVV